MNHWKPIFKTLTTPGEPEVLLWWADGTIKAFTLIANMDVLVWFGPGDDAMTQANSVTLLKGDYMYENGVAISERIRMVNLNPGETPTVRGVAWG